MDLPDWVGQLWSELRFKELVGRETGQGFQRLFQQVMKAVDRDDFLNVRPIGRHGDFKCDGWGLESATCYAVYAPFTQKRADQVHRKIACDLHGAVQARPDMRAWRLVHNDAAGLSALVAASLVSLREEMGARAPQLTILAPWGPEDLWWLLRQAPAEARDSLLGTHGWRLHQPQIQVDDDPVSTAAGRSVAQLLDGFASGGVLDPLTAKAFAATLTMFLLGDKAAFEEQSSLLSQRCDDDPFEAMVTSIAFGIKALQLWEAATHESPQLWAEMMTHCGFTAPYFTQIVKSTRYGTELDEPLPDHPVDQRKVTMNLGQLTAATLQLTADHRTDPLVSVLQDLLISVQREPPRPRGEE